MVFFSSYLSIILVTVVFAAAVFLHLIKKNATAVGLYIAQSTAVALLLVLSALEKPTMLFFIAIIATIAVKIFVAPYFFFDLIRKHHLRFSVATYLNLPLTLIVVATLTALTRTAFFKEFTTFAPARPELLLIGLATIAMSLFVMVNRKGALSQMLGILSLENGVVTFALFAGLEQSPALQLGITFNILIWIIIAVIFTSMMYRQFGTLDVTAMKKLTE